MAERESGAQSVLSQRSSCTLDGVELFELIGSGSYAKVYRGEWNGIQVAVKQLHDILQDTGGQDREGLAKTFHKELGMNMELRHPNIIQFLGIVTPQQHRTTPAADRVGKDATSKPVPAVRRFRSFPMMVMELMHCTLDARLAEYRESGTRMPFSEAVNTATDIAAALVYLHGRRPPIAHRDLAPKNVLLSASGTAKLCDLGVAKWASGKPSQKNTEGPGTLPYMPPEVRFGRNYSLLEVDLYSFGVTLLEMSCGLEPNPKEFAHMKEDGSYQLVEERVRREKSFAALGEDNPMLDTIDQCLQSTVSKRPTAKQLLGIFQGTRGGQRYLSSKEEIAKKNCCLCEKREKKLRETIEEQEKEIARLRETNKMLESFCEEQLKQLKTKFQTAALEGERYQLQLREVQEALDEQIETNRRLEATNDWANDINILLRQKVEMDSQLFRTKPRTGTFLEKSVSLKYPSEQRPKPVPKPRRRLASSKSIEKLDDLSSDANRLGNSCHQPPRALCRRPNISISVSSLPALMTEEATYLQLDEVAMLKDKQKNTLRSVGKSRSISATKKQRSSYENPDDPIYVKFPVTEPPTPPPRDQYFRFSHISAKRATSLYSNRSQDQRALRPNQLSVIDEKDESVKSPQGLMTPRNQHTTQSMRSPRVKSDCLLLESDPFLRRPSFDRQRSRGDILISEVVTSVKAKNPGDLSAKKGELVKVTNSVIEKKLCVAVKTNGDSGTIRKKNLQQVVPADIQYDPSNPAPSSRRGVFDHIARCGNPHDQWVSPVDTMKIIIIPSSLHAGDTGLLVKMTDFLLCCTDDEEESKFDIDLREQRLLKLTGYVLQCHPEGNNGAPVHWTMEGSQNGRTWSHLSEESGAYFRRSNTRYFPVTNPTPCRYFRLTQLGKNAESNYRFCLSGIEFYGQLYSSVAMEKHTEYND